MLERRAADNGVVYYRSPLLDQIGVPHAFSTRIGGISPAPFDSLNLGNPSGCSIVDDYDRIWQNYRLLADAAGCCQGELLRVHQVHGSVVAQAERKLPFDTAAQADAIVLDHPGRIATVRVADCTPVLLADESGERGRRCMPGARGVVSGVVVEAIKKLRERACAARSPPPSVRAFRWSLSRLAPRYWKNFCGLLGIRCPSKAARTEKEASISPGRSNRS